MSALSYNLGTTISDVSEENINQSTIDRYNFENFDKIDKNLDNIFNQAESIMNNYSTHEEKQRTFIVYKNSYTTMNSILLDNEMYSRPATSIQSGPADAGSDDRKKTVSDLQRELIKSFKVTNYSAIENRKQMRMYRRMKILEKILQKREATAKDFLKNQGDYKTYAWNLLTYSIAPTVLASGIAGVGIMFQAVVILKSIANPTIWLSFGEKIFTNKVYFSLFNDIMSGLNIFNRTEFLRLQQQYIEVNAYLSTPSSPSSLSKTDEEKAEFIKKTIMAVFELDDGSGQPYTKDMFKTEFGVDFETPIASFFQFIKNIIDKKNLEEPLILNNASWFDFIIQNFNSPKFKFAFAAFGLAVPIVGYITTTLQIFNEFQHVHSAIALRGIKDFHKLSSYRNFMTVYGDTVSTISTTNASELINYIFQNDQTASGIAQFVGLFGLTSQTFGVVISTGTNAVLQSTIEGYFEKIMRDAKAKKKEEEELKTLEKREDELVAEIEKEVVMRSNYKGQGKTNEEIVELLSGNDPDDSELKLKFFVSRYLVIFKRQFLKFKDDPVIYLNSMIATLCTIHNIKSLFYMYAFSNLATEIFPALALKGIFHKELIPYLQSKLPVFSLANLSIEAIKYVTFGFFDNWSVSNFLQRFINLYFGYSSDEQVNEQLNILRNQWIKEIVDDFQVIQGYLQNEFFKTDLGMSIEKFFAKLDEFILVRISKTVCKFTYSLVLIPAFQIKLAEKIPKFNTNFFNIIFNVNNEDSLKRLASWVTNKMYNMQSSGLSLNQMSSAFVEFMDNDKILYKNVIPFLSMEGYYETQDFNLDRLLGKVMTEDSNDKSFKINDWINTWERNRPTQYLSRIFSLFYRVNFITQLSKDKFFGLKSIKHGGKDQLIRINAFTVMRQFYTITGLTLPVVDTSHPEYGTTLAELDTFDTGNPDNSVKYKDRLANMIQYEESFKADLFKIQFVKYSEYMKAQRQQQQGQGQQLYYDIIDDFNYYDFISWLQEEKRTLLTTNQSTTVKYDPIKGNALEVALLDEVMKYTTETLLIEGLDVLSSQNNHAQQILLNMFSLGELDPRYSSIEALINQGQGQQGRQGQQGQTRYQDFLEHNYQRDYSVKSFEMVAASNSEVEIIIPNFVGFYSSNVDMIEFLDFQSKMRYVLSQTDVDSLFSKLNEVRTALNGNNEELSVLESKYNKKLAPIYRKIYRMYIDFVRIYSGTNNKDTVKLASLGFDYTKFKDKFIADIKEKNNFTFKTTDDILTVIDEEERNARSKGEESLSQILGAIIKKCTANGKTYYISKTTDLDINTFKKVKNCIVDPRLTSNDLLTILLHPEMIVYIRNYITTKQSNNQPIFSGGYFNTLFTTIIERNMFQIMYETLEEQITEGRDEIAREDRGKLEEELNKPTTVANRKVQIEQILKQLSEKEFHNKELVAFKDVFHEMTLRAKTSARAGADLYDYLSYTFDNNNQIEQNNLYSTMEATTTVKTRVDELKSLCNNNNETTKTNIYDFLSEITTPDPKVFFIQLSNVRNINSTGGMVSYFDIDELAKKIPYLRDIMTEMKTMSYSTAQLFEKLDIKLKKRNPLLPHIQEDYVDCQQLQEYLTKYKEWLEFQEKTYMFYRRGLFFSINASMYKNIEEYRTDIRSFYSDYYRDLTRLHEKYKAKTPELQQVSILPSSTPRAGNTPPGSSAPEPPSGSSGGPALQVELPSEESRADMARKEAEKQKQQEKEKEETKEKQQQEEDEKQQEEEGEDEKKKEELKQQYSLLFGGNDFLDFLNKLATMAGGTENMPPESSGTTITENEPDEYDSSREKGAKEMCEENALNWWHYVGTPDNPYKVKNDREFTKEQAKSCSDQNVLMKFYEFVASAGDIVLQLVESFFLYIVWPALNIASVIAHATGNTEVALVIDNILIPMCLLIANNASCFPFILLMMISFILEILTNNPAFRADLDKNFIKMFLISQFIYYYGAFTNSKFGKSKVRTCKANIERQLQANPFLNYLIGPYLDIDKIKTMNDRSIRLLTPDVTINGVSVTKYNKSDIEKYNPFGNLNLGQIDPDLERYYTGSGIKPNDNYFATIFLLLPYILNDTSPAVITAKEAFEQKESAAIGGGPSIDEADYRRLPMFAAFLLQISKGNDFNFIINYFSSRIFNQLPPPTGQSAWFQVKIMALLDPIHGGTYRQNLITVIGEIIFASIENEIIRMYLFTTLFGNKSSSLKNPDGGINLFRDNIDELVKNLLAKYTDVNGQLNTTGVLSDLNQQINKAISDTTTAIWDYLMGRGPPPPRPPSAKDDFNKDIEKMIEDNKYMSPDDITNLVNRASTHFNDATCRPP